jgi:hypothetical protein
VNLAGCAEHQAKEENQGLREMDTENPTSEKSQTPAGAGPGGIPTSIGTGRGFPE